MYSFNGKWITNIIADDWWIINFSLNRFILCDEEKIPFKKMENFPFEMLMITGKKIEIKNCENWRIND